MGARGNSGVILSQILRGLRRRRCKGADATLGATRSPRRSKAASAAAYQAVLKPIEGTILTVVRESGRRGRRRGRRRRRRSVEVLRAARAAGKAALDSTPELLRC